MPKKAGNQRSYFEFALWAYALGRLPTIKEVEGYFQVCRQSAWRIHRNWIQAKQHHRIHQAGGSQSDTPPKSGHPHEPDH